MAKNRRILAMMKLRAAVVLAVVAASVSFVYSSDDGRLRFDILEYDDVLKEGALKSIAEHLRRKGNKDGDDVVQGAFECARDILSWALPWSEEWALRMHDANGKLSSGILTGHLHALGQFDECLAVDSGNLTRHRIRGKYCFAKLPIPEALLNATGTGGESKVDLERRRRTGDGAAAADHESRVAAVYDRYGRFSFNWAVCLPASCRPQEIQEWLREMINVPETSKPLITVEEDDCQIDEPFEWPGKTIAAVTIFSFFACLIFVSSMYDILTRGNTEKHRLHNFFIAFSMKTNGRKLVTINKSSSTLRCIHGIRTLSVAWIMLNHRYSMNIIYPEINTASGWDWSTKYWSMPIVGGAVGVDTFFVLSGFLLAYLFFKQHHGKSSFNLPLFYFHRFIRLWPALAMIVLFQTCILPYLGSGPYWKTNVRMIQEPCLKYWWTDLLYLQNYINPLNPCIEVLWYLCVDMHLYILSPILIYPLLKKPKLGVVNLIFWIVAAQTVVVTMSYVNNWGAILIGGNVDYIKRYYSYTHMRAVPWLLGFAAGYIHYKTYKRKIKLNKAVVICGWIAAISILWSVIYGTFPLQQDDHEVNLLQDGTYNAFARTGWAVGILWVVFACIWGYGGPINWLLSLRAWELFGRLTYSIYLLHDELQFSHIALQRTSREFAHYYIFYDYFGDLMLNICLAIFWSLSFEAPFLSFEKALFSKAKPKPTVEKETKDP